MRKIALSMMLAAIFSLPAYAQLNNPKKVFLESGTNTYLNTSTNNVGIGSSTPGAKLDVVGTTRTQNLTVTGTCTGCGGGGSAAGGLGAIQYNSPVGTLAGKEQVLSFNGTNVGIGTTNGKQLLDVEGIAYFSGNMGVGTTTTVNKLSVGGGVSIGTLYTSTTAPSNGVIVQGNIGVGNTAPSVPFQVTTQPGGYGSNIMTGGTATANATYQSNVPGNAVDGNTSTQWMQNNGATVGQWFYDLGSGVTKTVQKLGIYPWGDPTGGIRNFTLSGSNDGTNYTTIYAGLVPNSLVFTYFTFSNSIAYRYYQIAINDTWRGANTTSGIAEIQMFETVGGNGSDFTVGIGGNVGINNPSAAANLEVKKINSTDRLIAATSSVTGDLFVVNSAGNVGINSINPINTLDVSGNITTSGGISTNHRTLFADTLNTSAVRLASNTTISSAAVNLLIGNDSTWTKTSLFNNGTELVTLNNNNVGIGTILPISKLDVAGSDSGTSITSASAAMASITNKDKTTNNFSDLAFSQTNSSGATIPSAKISGIFTNHTSGSETSDLSFVQLNNGTARENMHILANGNVGINSSNPGFILDVQGNVGLGTLNPLTVLGNSIGFFGVPATNVTGTGSVVLSAGATLTGITTSPTLRGASSSSGTIVIEGSNAASPADAAGIYVKAGISATKNALSINGASGNVGINTAVPSIMNQFVVNGRVGIGTANSSYVTTSVPDGSSMIIEQNVGIGTLNPPTRLYVSGTIQGSGGYNSADGTSGATVTTCTGFKNGLCISGT